MNNECFVTGGYLPNDNLSYGYSKLVIVKVEWNQDLSNLNTGNQVQSCTDASSELQVTYTNIRKDMLKSTRKAVRRIWSARLQIYLDANH